MLGIVIKREFTTILTSKAMRISTAIVVALLLLAGVAGRIFLHNDEESTPQAIHIAVTQDASPLTEFLVGQGGIEVVEASGNPETILQDNEEIEAVVSGIPAEPVLSAPGEANAIREKVVLASTLYLVDQQGVLTPELSSQLVRLSFLQVNVISTNAMSSNPVGYLAGTIGCALLMVIVLLGISTLSAGVVEEKSSRVVEILLTTVRPRTFLLGKILGIGSAMLIIFAVYLTALFSGLAIAGLLSNLSALGNLGLWGFLPVVLLWIVLGYFTYAALIGGLAATVSRSEDLGAVQTPVVFFQMIPFYAALYLVPLLPDASITRILSYVPFLSPYMMPMRTALDSVALWEQLLAAAVTLVCIPLLSILAGKIYERSILRTGERVKITSLFRGSQG